HSSLFSNAQPTTQISTLSLHDALPISSRLVMAGVNLKRVQEYMGHSTIAMTMRYAHLAPERGQADIERLVTPIAPEVTTDPKVRSEEHTSELQSRSDLVCRLLLEKKKQ